MISRNFFIICLLIISVTIAQAENPRDMTFEPLSFDAPEPVRFVTDNGITVYFLEDHQLPVVTTMALFRGGGAYDPIEQAGLSGITARLMRSGGAGDRSPEQIDDDLDFVGAGIGSSSDDENLTMNLRTLKKDVHLGFEILSDILLSPQFDSAKLVLELSNKKDRILRRNDDPRDVTRRVFYQVLYKGHPYGLYSSLESIDRIDREAVIECYHRFYNPDNCILAISGDLTLAEVKALLTGYFGTWKKAGVEIPALPEATQLSKPGVYYAKKDINQANIRFGHLCITDKNPDRFALEIMNFALGGGGFTSRIIRQVRTSAGLAYSVGTYISERALRGSFFGYCQTGAETMSQALEMMLDLITEVRNNGITAEELTLARESIVNGFVFNYATASQVVNACAHLEFDGFPRDQLKRDIEAYQAVTLEDCNRVAREYLDPDNSIIVITGNAETFDKPLSTFGQVTEVSMEIK